MRCSVITLSDNWFMALGLSFFLLSSYRNLEYRIVQFKHRVSDSCPSLHAIQREKQLTVERTKKRSSAVPCLLFFFLRPLYPIPSFITPTSKPLFLSSLPRSPNNCYFVSHPLFLFLGALFSVPFIICIVTYLSGISFPYLLSSIFFP
jgi:hypothetical protein